jgi:hypothetical protein
MSAGASMTCSHVASLIGHDAGSLDRRSTCSGTLGVGSRTTSDGLPIARSDYPSRMDSGTGVFEIIQTTRSMRRLKPDPVPDELIVKILQAGLSAANGGNVQSWRFMVSKDRQIKQNVQRYYKKAYDETVGPRYRDELPAGVTRERYARQGSAVEYLTHHFAEAPVWTVACLEEATPGVLCPGNNDRNGFFRCGSDRIGEDVGLGAVSCCGTRSPDTSCRA